MHRAFTMFNFRQDVEFRPINVYNSIKIILTEITSTNPQNVQFQICYMFVYVFRCWQYAAWIFAGNFRVNFRARSNPVHRNVYHACRSISFRKDYGFLNLMKRMHVPCVQYTFPCICKWYVHRCLCESKWMEDGWNTSVSLLEFHCENSLNFADVDNVLRIFNFRHTILFCIYARDYCKLFCEL